MTDTGPSSDRVKPPARFSLRVRLPLLISALIGIVLSTFLWVAHQQVERTLLRAGGERAQAAAERLALLLGEQTRQRLETVQRAARSSAVRGFLENRGDDTAAAARQRLESLTTPGQPAIELWTGAGQRVLTVTPPTASRDPAPQVIPDTAVPLAPGLTPFEVSNGVIVWAAVAVVQQEEPGATAPSPQSRRLGYVVSARILSTRSQATVISGLVGEGAVVEIGNRADGVWTDLAKVVPAPPVDLGRAGVAEYQDVEGKGRLGASALIGGTPWAVWVEFPRDEVVAPARAFLGRMLVFALGFVIAAALLAWLLSTHITIPLHDLTQAAEAIASGQYVERGAVGQRRDEIGRLGAAFDSMARQVQGVQRELEERVRQRTASLEEAGASLERHIAELQARRQELDGFFALSLDMLCIADREGHFRRLNPAWSDALGWTDAELLATPFTDFVHADDRERTLHRIVELGRGQTASAFENRYACRDGSYRWLQWKAIPAPDGESVYASARDITDQKAAELRIQALNTQLEQRVGELKALTHELEAFSYSVSHDLRAPLRHITGFAALLEQSVAPGLDDQGRRYVGIISDAATRMGRLIDDLLTFSRMGRAELLHGRVDLAALADEVRQDVVAGLANRRIAWNVHPLPVVEGDASMLRIALMNLIANAVKYTAGRPAAEIEIGCQHSSGEAVVFVRDNGVGFDMQYAHKLFGVFQRLHSSDQFEGTGIGLANVRRIVHRHGGRTWAEGAVDEGATFYMALPFHESQTT